MGRMSTEIERAYAAGFFDGEGCVSITIHQQRSRPGFRLIATVSQDAVEPLHALQEIWGGHVAARKPRPNGKISHMWRTSSRSAVVFLTDIRPYCLVKGEGIDLGLEFAARVDNHVGRSGLGDDELASRRRLHDELRAFNSGARHMTGGQ